MKYNHNKKRNTALIYEVIINELTKASLKKDAQKKDKIVMVLKEFFGKGKILSKELDIYKSLADSIYPSRELAEKVLSESKRQFRALDRKKVFNEQTRLINKINKSLTKDVWNNYIFSFKKVATLNQVLQSDLPPKKQVVLESKLIESLLEPKGVEKKFPKVNNLAMKKFIENFNDKYTEQLDEAQKQFLNKYIMSHVDGGLEFKASIYTEIDRLKTVLRESLGHSPKDTQTKIQKVLDKISDYNQRKIDKDLVYEVFKIQMLASEISK